MSNNTKHPCIISKNFILLNPSSNPLFLYSQEQERFNISTSFLESSVNSRRIYFYLGYPYKNIIEKISSVDKCSVLFGYCEMKYIRHDLKKLLNNNRPFKIVLDYLPKEFSTTDILEIEQMLFNHVGGWGKSNISYMSMFNINSLNLDISELMKFHKQILITAENNLLLMHDYNTKNNKKKFPIKIDNTNLLDSIVKDNLLLIVLKSISNKGLSGNDIIKIISKKFLTRLSPGTMYPLLYSLQKEEIVEMRYEGKKIKLYKLTEKGRYLLNKELSNFFTLQEYLREFLE